MRFTRRIASLAATVAVGGLGLAAAVTPTPAAAASSHGAMQHRHRPAGLRCASPGHPRVTVVMVHGAFAQPSSWDGEVSELRAAGCQVHAIGNPVMNLTTDAQTVADYVKTIPGPVVLVGHSYGGSVITNAAAEVSNVVGLVYVDAYAPAVGETSMQLDGATSVLNTLPMSALFTTFPYPGAPPGAVDMMLNEPVFLHDFAESVPRHEAINLYDEQTPASSAAFSTPSQYAAWQTIPSWYFISTGDKIITPQEELAMAHRAHSHITIFHGGSHLTLVSNPTAVTRTIGKALHSILTH